MMRARLDGGVGHAEPEVEAGNLIVGLSSLAPDVLGTPSRHVRLGHHVEDETSLGMYQSWICATAVFI